MNDDGVEPNRRDFLKLFVHATCGASVLAARGALGDTTCNPMGICVSQVDFAQFAQDAYRPQYQPEWCWAACISMIFSFYGHPVSQPRIVSEVYGLPVNMPAPYGGVIANQLNRTWTDDNGDRFRAHLTGVYDADADIDTLQNPILIAELDDDHPVVIGAGGHAMVLTSMQYARTPYGPNIVRCGVFDPWPGRGARGLTPPEMVPVERGGALRFAATVRIT